MEKKIEEKITFSEIIYVCTYILCLVEDFVVLLLRHPVHKTVFQNVLFL